MAVERCGGDNLGQLSHGSQVGHVFHQRIAGISEQVAAERR